MQTLTKTNFGIAIAYLVPGFIALFGLSFQSTMISSWLLDRDGVTIGGFLYSTLSALTLGLFCSTSRWLLLDSIHHATGVTRPNWDFGRLEQNLGAYVLLEENHYRFYQFYGNSLVALLAAYACWRETSATELHLIGDIAIAVIATILFLGSRDTLKKYYGRVEALLTSRAHLLIVP